jgi:tRNA(Ile)-lysidine synthase
MAVTHAVAVAYSGGRDSTALLHATARAAKLTGGALTVHALHVHHGLSAHADAWLRHGQQTCRRWAARGLPVQFHFERVQVQVGAGISIEAAARDLRYAALVRMARAAGCATVLLAHHREDQAETVLLQALRGAGAAGLAAMPRQIERWGLTWARPWLAQPRAAIETYVHRHQLRHIEDDSNTDTRYARNKLRHEVWPALMQAFPQAPQVLGAVAQHAQDAAECLAALAERDLQQVRGAYGLDVAALLALGPARGRNLLRVWIQQLTRQAPPATLLQRLSAELASASNGRWPLGEHGWLACHRGELIWQSMVVALDRPTDVLLTLAAPGLYPLPAWGGALRVEVVDAQGVVPEQLRSVCLRPRQGGEQFQRAPATPPRSLKKQFQAAGVPAWQRDAPLLWAGEQLLWVSGLGVDARCWAPSGQPQWCLHWLPEATESAVRWPQVDAGLSSG